MAYYAVFMTAASVFSRKNALVGAASGQPYDIVIVGGGATGLGAAVDAAARGYRTLLLEQHDFAKGTSSRSTKLVHGGVRYLQAGQRLAGARGAARARPAAAATRRTWCTTCRSWCRATTGGRGRSTASA